MEFTSSELDAVASLTSCVVSDFPVWSLDDALEGECYADVSGQMPDVVGTAHVYLRICFPLDNRHNKLVVRREAFCTRSQPSNKVTDKQFERLCKGIFAGTRTGLILQNRNEPKMCSNLQLDVFRVVCSSKSIRLLILEVAMVGAIKQALDDARKQLA